MAFYVYMLCCNDGSYYVGHTDDIEQRMDAHAHGKVPGYTYERRPVKLVFMQDFATRDQAFEAERKIKGWSRKKKEALIDKNWQLISLLGSRSK